MVFIKSNCIKGYMSCQIQIRKFTFEIMVILIPKFFTLPSFGQLTKKKTLVEHYKKQNSSKTIKSHTQKAEDFKEIQFSVIYIDCNHIIWYLLSKPRLNKYENDFTNCRVHSDLKEVLLAAVLSQYCTRIHYNGNETSIKFTNTEI